MDRKTKQKKRRRERRNTCLKRYQAIYRNSFHKNIKFKNKQEKKWENSKKIKGTDLCGDFFVDKQLWTEFVYKPFGHALKVNNENRQVLGGLNLKP